MSAYVYEQSALQEEGSHHLFKQGRGSEQIEQFSYKLEEKGGDCTKIQYVSSDLSSAYRAGIRLCFSNTKHTVDKFHVKKLLLDAMDQVRIAEHRDQRKKWKMGICR